ncbi:MAG: hypothetical protein QE265_05990 [Rhodoferax sp.]|nr:hypothetical protein [Rhodoferax sp.]
MTVVAGTQYIYTIVVTAAAGQGVAIELGGVASAMFQTPGTYTGTITPTATGGLRVKRGGAAAGSGGAVTSVSLKVAEPDRSAKANGLNIVGTLTKAPVAPGAQLVGYSGFSASNYLEQPYSANLDFGTRDFCVMGWGTHTHATASGTAFERWGPGGSGARFRLQMSAGNAYWNVTDGTNSAQVSAAVAGSNTGALIFWVCIKRGPVLELWVNAALVGTASAASVGSLSNASAVLRIGEVVSGTSSPMLGQLELWRISEPPPSADQIAKIYRDELALFQPGAQCTIAGTSTAVTALSYDDDTDLLHVGTSWGRTSFHDLVRVDSEATTVGAITTISAQGGAVVMGGTNGRIYQPALTLRDELRRKREARLALGKEPVFFDFDPVTFTASPTSGTNALTASSVVGTPYVGMGITGSGIPAGTVLTSISGANYTMSNNATSSSGAVIIAQNTLTLQQGFAPKAVYVAGALKRAGVTKDYVLSDDGFRKTVVLGVGSGSWVSVMAVRA